MSLAFLCNFDLFFYFSIESVFHCDFPKFGLQICKWFQKWDLLHLHWMYGQRRQRKWQLCCRVSKQAQCLKITKKSHFTKLTKDQSLTVWLVIEKNTVQMRHCCWFFKILCRFFPLWQDLDTDLMMYFADLESVAFSFIQGQVAQSTKIVATSNRQGFPPPLRHQRHLRWHTPSKNVQMVSGKYRKKDKSC